MSENTEFVPELTLNPDGFPSFEEALAATEAPAAAAAAAAPTLEEDNTVIKESIDSQMSSLTEEERKQVEAFSKQIDITDTNTVLTYGAASQKHISDFSDTALNAVRTKDLGEVGDMLSDLVVELKGFNFDEKQKKGLFGLKKKAQHKIETLKADYAKAEVNVDKISEMLEKHQVVLMKDTAMLDKMYETNQGYFKELTMYILAGKTKLDECRTVTLPALQKKAEESGLPEDAQAASDFANMINRFEKKLYDLELTRMVSVQMAPQIRLIQNNDTLLVEKIQTSIVNTIPLWKSQMVLALGLYHSQQAMQAQHEVTEMTNELLKKNAEMLKTGSVEVAKESERGVVDIDTLVETNRMLIETLEEVQQIQRDGSARRHAAEAELGRIEGELKQKLLDLRR
ncbi:MAG: toxic anion resistance protein [Oscillospiraceae bacterium]|nr:toxic anion resistance protein [Oscillospiraceae bacterium]